MKINLKNLLLHKFPMDETEQAILLNAISQLEKELRKWRDCLVEFKNHVICIDGVFCCFRRKYLSPPVKQFHRFTPLPSCASECRFKPNLKEELKI